MDQQVQEAQCNGAEPDVQDSQLQVFQFYLLTSPCAYNTTGFLIILNSLVYFQNQKNVR